MGAEQSNSKTLNVSKDDMSPYMHPIGERAPDREGLMGIRSKLSSVSSGVRSGSVSSVYSPTSQPVHSSSVSSSNTATAPSGSSRFNRAFSTSFSSLPTSQSRDIVVVNEGRPANQDDFDYSRQLEQLHRIPRVTPLYRSRSLSTSFDHKSALHFCARYQEHIRQCADAVSFDQNALTCRIKEVDAQCTGHDEKVRDRNRKQARCLEQLQRFNQIQQTAQRIAALIRTFEADLNDLNGALPETLQLEPFCFNPAQMYHQQQQQQHQSSRDQSQRREQQNSHSVPNVESPVSSIVIL